MDSTNAIEVRGLYKSFKLVYDKPNTLKERLLTLFKQSNVTRKEILKDINLNIKKGETVALIGTNGSGKSTLLKLMTKILYPNQGTLSTNGKLTSLLELGAGFHPDFTGRENIYFNASIFGLTRKEIDQRIDEIIAFSELGDFIDNPIRTYSSGMYMRLAFSIAINVDAEILLLDEILAVGDQHFQDKCFEKLKELKSSDKTIVIVSHSLDVVKEICDRAVWIYHGGVQLDGDPAYVISEYLKQIAIDHKEQVKKSQESGEHKTRGVMFVDEPVAFSDVKYGQVFRLRGWSLANCEDSYYKVSINGKEVEGFIPERRDDAVAAYHEDFLGFTDPERVGFMKEVLLDDYRDVIEESGKSSFKIVAELYDNTNKCLTTKDVVVNIEVE